MQHTQENNVTNMQIDVETNEIQEMGNSKNDLITYNIKLKFSDEYILDLSCNAETQIISLVKKAIIFKSDGLLNELEIEHIPIDRFNKFKIVHRGHIIDYTKNDVTIADINHFNDNDVFYCVFPPLTNVEIENIKKSMVLSEDTLMQFTNSENFINMFKNFANFAQLDASIRQNKNEVPEDCIKLLISSSAFIEHYKICQNFEQLKLLCEKCENIRKYSSDEEFEQPIANSKKIKKIKMAKKTGKKTKKEQYIDQINELQSMGFNCDEERVINILEKHNGNMQPVVEELLG